MGPVSACDVWEAFHHESGKPMYRLPLPLVTLFLGKYVGFLWRKWMRYNNDTFVPVIVSLRIFSAAVALVS